MKIEHILIFFIQGLKWCKVSEKVGAGISMGFTVKMCLLQMIITNKAIILINYLKNS